MILSRKWANDYVDLTDIDNKTFCDEMTLSGSKVELTHDLGSEISNVVVGQIRSMERHPDSDHMWVCQIDVGQAEPVQIVTGAWNIHVGDLVPVALHKSTLPGGKKIEKGKLRGVESNGMMCGLYELGLDERDFPYAVITAAALLGDYKAIDPAKPSIPADIKAGDDIKAEVLLNGKPVKAPLGLTYDGYSAEQDAYMAKAETGADGMASFKVTKPGLWMLRTEVTEKLTDGSADKRNMRATYVFPVMK